MILSCCSLSFREEPIEGIVRKYAAIGFDAIEIMQRQIQNHSDDALKALREVADSAGIKVLVIAPYFILTRGQPHWDETMQIADATIKSAHILGATKVRTFTDVAHDGIGSDVATESHWEQAVTGLKQITAKDRSLTFVVETHPHTLADTVEASEKLISRVGAPNLKLNFQPTPPMLRYGLNDAFDRLLPSIAHMHLHQISSEGEATYLDNAGALDLPGFMAHIRQRGFDQSISVEYCWKNVPWDRMQPAHDLMRKWLA
jgi:3-dehydroshikimate dehydratase